jgi:hypothetical protein
MPFAQQLLPDLAGAVDAVVGRVDALDVGVQFGVADRPRRGWPPLDGVVGAGGHRAAVFGQDTADRLDTEHVGVLVDEGHECVCGRSSSAAKKAEAAFRISLAGRSSAFSRRSRFSLADSILSRDQVSTEPGAIHPSRHPSRREPEPDRQGALLRAVATHPRGLHPVTGTRRRPPAEPAGPPHARLQHPPIGHRPGGRHAPQRLFS